MIGNIFLYLPNNFIGLFLLLVIFVLTFLLIFKLNKSEWIIYTLLVWFPLESLILMYTPIEFFAYVKYIPEIIMYGLAFGSLISYIKDKRKILPKQPLNKWLIAFVVVALISLLLNFYSWTTWLLGLRQILRFVLLVFVILWMDYDEKILKKIIKFGATMIALEIILGFVQYLSGGYLDPYLFSSRTVSIGNLALLGGLEEFWTQGSRVFATLGRYDQLGSFVALGIILMFPFVFFLKKRQDKFWYFIFFILAFVVLYLTKSRASWIATFLGVVTIGWFLRKDKRVALGIGVFLTIFVAYLGFFALSHDNVLSIGDKPTQTLGERVFEAFSIQGLRDSYDGYGRIFFIINTPRMVVTKYPFFGVGPGQYGGGVAAALLNTDMYDRLHLPFGIQNIFGQIDNNWMSIWGEVGTIGLIVWIMVFVTIIKMSLLVRNKTENIFEKNLAEGLIGLTVGIMAIGFFGPYFEFRSLMFYYWATVGVVMVFFVRRYNKNYLEN